MLLAIIAYVHEKYSRSELTFVGLVEMIAIFRKLNQKLDNFGNTAFPISLRSAKHHLSDLHFTMDRQNIKHAQQNNR